MDIEKTIQVHKSMIQKYPYISTCAMSKFLTKVLFNLEKSLPVLVLEKESADKIISLVCKITTGLLRNETINKDVVVEHSFKALKLLGVDHSEEKPLLLTSFLKDSFQLAENGELDLSADSWNFLFLTNPYAVTATTFELLSECYDIIKNSNTSRVNSILSGSKLVNACGKLPLVFQNVLAITSSIWFKSEGNVRIQSFLCQLVKTVESLCTTHPFVFHFPENVQHLVMLLAAAELPQTSSYHMLWSIMIKSLELKVCSTNDIVMLMGVYPIWYERLLKEAKQQINDEAVRLLKLLWSHLDEEKFEDEVQSLMFPVIET